MPRKGEDENVRLRNTSNPGGLAPYTDYRKYMGMSQPQRFEEMSKDSRVVDFRRGVHTSPRHVEFYIGLFGRIPAGTPHCAR